MKEGLTKYWCKIEEIKEKHLDADFECEAMTKPVAISYSKLVAISYFKPVAIARTWLLAETAVSDLGQEM